MFNKFEIQKSNIKMDKDITVERIFNDKELREDLEIKMFLERYNKLHNSDYMIFQKREKPDYFVKNNKGDILGVELSSIYKDDKVVGAEHKYEGSAKYGVYDSKTHQEKRNLYFKRIFDKIDEKRNKIREGKYDTTYPLILSLYMNDYYNMYIDFSELELFVKFNGRYFNNTKKELTSISIIFGSKGYINV